MVDNVLCNERHQRIDKNIENIYHKIDKINNRTNVVLTAVIVNLLTYIGILLKGVM